MYSHHLPNVCVFCEFYCLRMLFMLSVKLLCSIVLLPFSAILPNLILFIFHVPNTTVLTFTVKPFFVICLCLYLPKPIWGCYVPGRTHTQWRYSIMVYVILLCFSFCLEPKLFPSWDIYQVTTWGASNRIESSVLEWLRKLAGTPMVLNLFWPIPWTIFKKKDGSVYFTAKMLAATDRLELLCR